MWHPENAPATRPQRRWWPLVLIALALSVAVVALSVLWHLRSTRDAAVRPDWQPPPQQHLASPMLVQPAPGWRTNATTLGLPEFSKGSSSVLRFATNQDPFESTPFIGNIDDKAYFVAGVFDGTQNRWLLVGVDTRTGQALFAPTSLGDGPRSPACFLNGPTALLCLDRETDSSTARVIAADSGVVSFVGATDLRTSPSALTVRQVGLYAVAETENQGVYGIGPKADTTWFVPGAGSVDQKYARGTDTAQSALASQTAPGGESDGKVAFSLSDGTVIATQDGENVLQQIAMYPGGFAAEVAAGDAPETVQFFDETGKRIGDASIRGLLSRDSMELPMISLTSGGWAVYSPGGGQLLEQEGDMPAESRLVGSTFFVKDPGESMDRSWQQYDLVTGAKGNECSYDLGSGYIATDGKVGIFESGNPNVGLITKAFNLRTCEALWSIDSPAGSFRDVWRVNTNLIQLSDDGTELTSLVAPS